MIAGAPPRLSASRAQETIRHLDRIHADLADIRHMLACYDQGVIDDPCDMAAKEIALCLPELEAAGRLLKELTLTVCPVCHGEGEVQFNLSWRQDPQMVDSAVCGECHGVGAVDGCVLPDGTPLLAGSTEPVNNDAGRTTLDGRSAAGVEEKGDYQ